MNDTTVVFCLILPPVTKRLCGSIVYLSVHLFHKRAVQHLRPSVDEHNSRQHIHSPTKSIFSI